MTTPQEAAQKVLGHYAGYAATWTIRLGLETGLLASIASHPQGVDAPRLAAMRGLDPTYTAVWCRAAYAGGILDVGADGAYVLAPHMTALLLDKEGPGYLGGMSRVLVAMRETFSAYPDVLASGRHATWADFPTEWIEAVGDAGQTFYTRMLAQVFGRLPRLQAALEGGGGVLDLACGLCRGPIKVARAYRRATFTGVDYDAKSLERAREVLVRAEVGERFDLKQSTLEDLDLHESHDVAVINISLHEARDMKRVVENAHRALRRGGTFVVSEFPFPETLEGCRALPGQIMSAIQFFEGHIGCQLQPTSRFVTLLREAGFDDVGTIDVTPTHVVIHGTK
jgi:SAM-dependent methyltransferase